MAEPHRARLLRARGGGGLSPTARVVVVGGGIGGLTAVLALRRAAIDVIAVERAPGSPAPDTGIQMWSNGVRVLRALGADDALRGASPVEIEEIRSWTGRSLVRVPVGDLARRAGATPPVVVRRSGVMEALTRAAAGARIHAACAGFDEAEDGVVARLDGGRSERADVLVGADGADSEVRRRLFPDAGARSLGYRYLRALVRFEHRALPAGRLVITYGPGDRLGAQALGDGWIYWFAGVSGGEGAPEDGPARKAFLRERYRRFAAPIPEVLAATDATAIRDDVIREVGPLPAWTAGRIALLGDAAHAMSPALGRGVGETMEDAAVLAECLSGVGPSAGPKGLAAALRAYEERRRVATTEVQARSHRIGRMACWRNPAAWRIRDFMMSRLAGRGMLERFEAEAAAARA